MASHPVVGPPSLQARTPRKPSLVVSKCSAFITPSIRDRAPVSGSTVPVVTLLGGVERAVPAAPSGLGAESEDTRAKCDPDSDPTHHHERVRGPEGDDFGAHEIMYVHTLM